MDLKNLRTSKTKEAEGVWQPMGEGCEFKIARWGNPAAQRRFQDLTRPYRRQLESGRMDPKKQAEILCRVEAETILLDWRGLTETPEDGGDPVELAYSTDEAFRVLMEYEEARLMVEDYAKDTEAYREREIEESVGN